ncbi:hypothetical protein ACEQPO_05885 [Bacillus sp. SL00103]
MLTVICWYGREVESKDEISQLCIASKKMQGRIKELISKISNSSSEVSKMSSLRTVTTESSQSAGKVSNYDEYE